jgi:predicted dehydrogenase
VISATSWKLAGGATMDVGCYAINLVRFLAGAEPEVVHAEARLASAKVDRWMTADLHFADGRSGRITCSLLSPQLLRLRAIVRGDRGEMRVFNPFAPHFYHRLTVRTAARLDAASASPAIDLHAPAAIVRRGRPHRRSRTDRRRRCDRQHGVIDAVYEKAGLPRRGSGE